MHGRVFPLSGKNHKIQRNRCLGPLPFMSCSSFVVLSFVISCPCAASLACAVPRMLLCVCVRVSERWRGPKTAGRELFGIPPLLLASAVKARNARFSFLLCFQVESASIRHGALLLHSSSRPAQLQQETAEKVAQPDLQKTSTQALHNSYETKREQKKTAIKSKLRRR